MKILPFILFAIVFSTLYAFGQDNVERDAAIELYRAGDYQGVVQKLEPLIATKKLDYMGAQYLAASYVHLDRSKDAEKMFRKADRMSKPKADPVQYDRRIKITEKPKPNFGFENMRQDPMGSISFAVEFKADGTLGFVFLVRSSSIGLIDGGTAAARGIKFEPAVINGKSVTTVSQIEYTYMFSVNLPTFHGDQPTRNE